MYQRESKTHKRQLNFSVAIITIKPNIQFVTFLVRRTTFSLQQQIGFFSVRWLFQPFVARTKDKCVIYYDFTPTTREYKDDPIDFKLEVSNTLATGRLHDRARCFSVRELRNFSISWDTGARGIVVGQDWHRLELDRTAITLIERPTRVSLAYRENRRSLVVHRERTHPRSPHRANRKTDENTFLKTFTDDISKSCYFLDKRSTALLFGEMTSRFANFFSAGLAPNEK